MTRSLYFWLSLKTRSCKSFDLLFLRAVPWENLGACCGRFRPGFFFCTNGV